MPIDHLPPRIQPAAYRLRAFMLDDNFIIAILGVGIISRGISFLPGIIGHGPRPGSHPAEGIMPIPYWGLIWVVAGAICIAVAWTRSTLIEAIGLAVGVGINLAWGTGYIIATILSEGESWANAIGYYTVSVLTTWAVWRGKRGDVRINDTKGVASAWKS